jgi:hypothetical protein
MVTFVLALAAPVLASSSAPSTSAPSSSSSAPSSSTPSTSTPSSSAPASKAPAKTDTKKMATKSASGTVKSASADSLVLVAGKDTADDNATVTYTEADGKMHAKSVSVKGKTAAAAKPKS